jgi:hypothetical protein
LAREQHKLAAILAADVVGYSRQFDARGGRLVARRSWLPQSSCTDQQAAG